MLGERRPHGRPLSQDVLDVTWAGQAEADVRARYAIENGQPVVRDLSVRKQGGQWATLGQNLSPEYHVVSGLRRMSSDHVGSLPAAGIAIDTGGGGEEPLVRVPRRAARNSRPERHPNAAAAAQTRRDPPRRLDVQGTRAAA